jgi:hypothetical protein
MGSFAIKLIDHRYDFPSSPANEIFIQYFLEAKERGSVIATETFLRYSDLLRYHGDMICSPANCIWTFLFLTLCISERLAIGGYITAIGPVRPRDKTGAHNKLKELLLWKGDFDSLPKGPGWEKAKTDKLSNLKVCTTDVQFPASLMC